MAAPTITSISSPMATRGAAGTALTLVGTNFGSPQGAGTLIVGGVAAIIADAGDWTATSITFRCDESPATPLGSQDIVITTADGSATLAKGVVVYDSTSGASVATIQMGKVLGAWINGVHFGDTEGGVQITPGRRTVPYKPDIVRGAALLERITEEWADVAFTCKQVEPAILARALGATSATAGSNTILSFGSAGGNLPEFSLIVQDENSMYHVFYRCNLASPAPIVLATEEWKGIPFNVHAMQISDDDPRVYDVQMPTPA